MSLIACAGESLVDILPTQDHGTRRAVPGGGPMNAAITAARLGAPTAFVGRISTDRYGEMIWSHLEDSEVILGAAERGPEPTARAEVFVDPVQRFEFHGEGTADTALEAVRTDALPSEPTILHSGTLGIFRGRTADTLAAWMESFAGLISFDPNVRPALIDDPGRWWSYADRWLDQAHLVRGSDEDLDWMGLDIRDILDRGTAAVVRTLGADGAEVFLAGGGHRSVPAPRIDFVDAVGAGDSFCGALLVRLHEAAATPDTIAGLDLGWWEASLRFAVGVAAITCARPGADPPLRRELLAP